MGRPKEVQTGLRRARGPSGHYYQYHIGCVPMPGKLAGELTTCMTWAYLNKLPFISHCNVWFLGGGYTPQLLLGDGDDDDDDDDVQ